MVGAPRAPCRGAAPGAPRAAAGPPRPPPRGVAARGAGPAGGAGGLAWEDVVTLETTLDDVTGEVLAYAIEKVLERGALDAWAVPAVGKKGRPCHVLHVLCRAGEEGAHVGTIVEETPTLGVRVRPCRRASVDRRVLTVQVPVGGSDHPVRFKTAHLDGAMVNVKGEYEDLARVARETGEPLKKVSGAAMRAFYEAEQLL